MTIIWDAIACGIPNDIFQDILMQDYQCSTNDLEMISELGRGAYGVVEKMKHKDTNIEMAVKVHMDCEFLSNLIRVWNVH